MGRRIPPSIKPFKGLVAAWKARHGASGNFYDPPRKGGHTPSRRSTRHADPKRKTTKRAYGTIKKKPYGVGSRGGVYWSAGRKPRYDPKPRNARKRAKSAIDKIVQGINSFLNMIVSPAGFVLGFMADPMADGRGLSGNTLAFMKGRLLNWKLPSWKGVSWWLFEDPEWNAQYKTPIWGGLALGIGGTIVKSFKVHPTVTKIAKILSIFGWGLFAGGITGLVTWLGGGNPHSIPTSHSNASTATIRPSSMYG